MKEYYSIIEISRLINRSRNFVKNAIKYLNIQGKIIYCNKARKKIIAYSDEEMKQIKLLNEETKNDPHYLNKQTNLKKYGVEHPFQNEDIQEKSKMSCLNKYGVSNYNQTEIAQSIRKRTMLKKYGVENPSQSEEIKDKKRKTNERKLEFAKSQNLYSVKELVRLFNKDDATITDVINKLNIDSHIEKDSRVYVKSSDLSILEDYFSKTEMSGTSYSEKEIVNFIKSICNYEIIENSKKIIYPKELDIYIPSKNLAIEYDGLYWHDENHVENNYHLNKTIACNNKG